MKIKKLLKRLNEIKKLLSNGRNWKLQDVEYEIEHIKTELSTLIKDVDDFGAEEDYNNE